MRKPWQDKQFLESLYLQEGMSLQDIADLVGVSRPTVLYWFKKFGIERREDATSGVYRAGCHMTEEQKAHLSEIWKERFTRPEDHPMFGHKHSEESRRKMSETKKRKRLERQMGISANEEPECPKP